MLASMIKWALSGFFGSSFCWLLWFVLAITAKSGRYEGWDTRSIVMSFENQIPFIMIMIGICTVASAVGGILHFFEEHHTNGLQ